MAEKKDKGLISFDPLAWMNDEDEDLEEQPEIEDASGEISSEEAELEIETLVDLVDPVVQGTETENNTDDCKVTLAATLNIQNVAELYEQFSKGLDNQDIIEIDASDVVSIDTATLQLLIVLKQEAVKLHKEVAIDFPSDKFIEAAELLGLAEMLEVDQAAAGFF